MLTFEQKPMLIQDVLKNSWLVYRASFSSVWYWNLLVGVFYSLPLLLGYLGVYQVGTDGRFHFSIIGTLIFIIFLIFSTYLSIVITQIMQSFIADGKPKINIILQDSFKKLPAVYCGMLFYYAVILTGFMLFLFPGLFVWIMFIMFLPLMVFDNLPLINSFITSARMVWGSWWQTFFVMFIPSFIMYMLRNFFRYASISDFLVFVLETIVITIIMPYFYATMLVQYHNLKYKMLVPESKPAPRPQS